MADLDCWLGPIGEQRKVTVWPSVAVSPDRPASTFTALSGRRVTRVGLRSYSSWSLAYQWSDAAVVAWLGELASGGVVWDVFLYTSVAARENLAPKALQSAGSGVVAGRRVLAAGDEAVGTYIVPCRPNTTYTLSALGDGVGVVTVVAAGTPSNGFGFGPFGSGPFGE